MSDRYILKDREPVRCYDLAEWGAFLNSPERVVKQETFGDIRVSTVFLGLNYDFTGEHSPILFETMVFGGPDDQLQRRYCSWSEAESGHAEIASKYKLNP